MTTIEVGYVGRLIDFVGGKMSESFTFAVEPNLAEVLDAVFDRHLALAEYCYALPDRTVKPTIMVNARRPGERAFSLPASARHLLSEQMLVDGTKMLIS